MESKSQRKRNKKKANKQLKDQEEVAETQALEGGESADMPIEETKENEHEEVQDVAEEECK